MEKLVEETKYLYFENNFFSLIIVSFNNLCMLILSPVRYFGRSFLISKLNFSAIDLTFLESVDI